MSKNKTFIAAAKPLAIDQITPAVDLAGYFRFKNAIRPIYRNPYHHFLLVESGWVEGNISRGHFKARAGAIICFRPAERNEYWSSNNVKFHQALMTLAPSPHNQCTPFFPGIGLLPEHVALGRAYEEMRDQFETFCISLSCNDAVNRLRIKAAVFNMLRIMVSVARPADRAALPPDEWERARWRLVSTEGLALKIHELAREMGSSVRHFNRIFRKRFGSPPKEYQIRARLAEARQRLYGTATPIKAIAADIGFANYCRSCPIWFHLCPVPTPAVS